MLPTWNEMALQRAWLMSRRGWVDGCFFWYWLTRVDPDKGPYNGRVCVMLPTYINGYFHQLTRTLFWIYLMYLGLSNSNSQTTTQDGLTQPKGLKHPASIHRYVCFGLDWKMNRCMGVTESQYQQRTSQDSQKAETDIHWAHRHTPLITSQSLRCK